ncbi:LysR family transcriptional regulator [Ponticaulis sp.]|uniref:LysR family transcriptional regulator n=1 Tax=Ponticaulis sp. TaxID=2020902 RepID=UPI0025FE7D89|nr:LysR family transcriptional regulator [Ponticaulis sp.]
MDDLKPLRVFVAIAEAGSLVGAGRALQLSPPTVTRILSDLETDLGVALFHRTTRAVRLTDTGQSFLVDAQRLIADFERAVENARGARETPKGVLRVTSSVLFGEHYILPVIQQFMSAYPDVRVEATFVDRMVNLVEEGFDVAIRIGELSDSNLLARRVGAVRRVVCSCETYLGKNGIPQHPSELKGHRIISARAVTPVDEWKFRDGIRVKLKPHLNVNHASTAIRAAQSDCGLTRVLSYQIGPELFDGKLKTVLEDYEPDELPINIVHAEGRSASAKIRSFTEMAAERLRKNPFLNR